jgi:hypothetical protein
MQTFLKPALALIALWLIPLYCWQWVSHGSIGLTEVFRALLVLVMIAGICAIHRRSSWVVFVWLPLMAFTGLGTLFAGVAFLSLPSASSGGASAAPLEGVATLVTLLGLLVLGLSAILSFSIRPLVWPSLGQTVIAGANTVALWLCTTAVLKASSTTEMHIHLLDPGGRPISGVSARYEHLAEDETEHRVLDSGGPLISDKNGLVALPGRPLRSQTRLTLSRSDYRTTTLTVDSQFTPHQTQFPVLLGLEETQFLSHGKVSLPAPLPRGTPLSLWLYLSPISDSPQTPATRQNLRSRTDVGHEPARYLDLATGKFSSTEPADLQLELAPNLFGNPFSRPLRITGLKGATLLLMEGAPTFAHPPSPYEHMYGIAPQTGYQPEIILTSPNARRSGQGQPTLYIRSQNGLLHTRLLLEFSPSAQGEEPRFTGTLITQTTGSRVLE